MQLALMTLTLTNIYCLFHPLSELGFVLSAAVPENLLQTRNGRRIVFASQLLLKAMEACLVLAQPKKAPSELPQGGYRGSEYPSASAWGAASQIFIKYDIDS